MKIPEADIEELAQFTFRGRQPRTATDWAHLWMAILTSAGLDLH
jgi:hypothetical protein